MTRAYRNGVNMRCNISQTSRVLRRSCGYGAGIIAVVRIDSYEGCRQMPLCNPHLGLSFNFRLFGFLKSTVLQRAGCRWVADLHRLPHRVFGRSQGERFLVHDIFNPMIFASFTLPS